jgi:uncharacterized protein DUF955
MHDWEEAEIEEKARQFRKKIGVDDLVWLEAPTLIYKVCHSFPPIQYARVADHELPDPGGRWDANRKVLIFRESVFAASNKFNPDARARFTIAHEVAHAVLAHEGIRNRSAQDSQEKKFSNRIRHLEAVTDRFAVAIYAPLHLIQPHETAESIALRFGLSKRASEIRAEEAARDYRRKNGLIRPIPDPIKRLLDELRNGKANK